MADSTYVTKIQKTDDGNTIVVASGGKITIETGGAIVLPTADPGVAGALYNDAGTIKVSAGA
jgi:hypothetical protein